MQRRSFLLGFGAALATPAIVRAENIMQIAVLRESLIPCQPPSAVMEEMGRLWMEARVVGYYRIAADRKRVKIHIDDGVSTLDHSGGFSFARMNELTEAWGVKPYPPAPDGRQG